MSDSGRQNAVLEQFVSWFSSQSQSLGNAARQARGYFDTRWTNEAWTRGCPVGIPSLGTLTAYGPHLRAPVGRIHWAGTETSDYWNGYMDGAVRSGERAAREVLAGL
jgi:monoamine oxidase